MSVSIGTMYKHDASSAVGICCTLEDCIVATKSKRESIPHDHCYLKLYKCAQKSAAAARGPAIQIQPFCIGIMGECGLVDQYIGCQARFIIAFAKAIRGIPPPRDRSCIDQIQVIVRHLLAGGMTQAVGRDAVSIDRAAANATALGHHCGGMKPQDGIGGSSAGPLQ